MERNPGKHAMDKAISLVTEKDVRNLYENRSNDPAKVLPEIVRDLLLASGVRRDKIEMPGTRIHGYDVIVDDAPAGAEFVPEGACVMELSVEASPGNKADSDYDERRSEEQLFRSAHAYVAVTARAWKDATGWATKKRALGEWRDVRALNSARLADWLNAAPDVALRHAVELGVATGPLQSLDGAWRSWSNVTREPDGNKPVPLIEDLVLCQRHNEIRELADFVALGSGAASIEADSADEAFGFALAFLRHRQRDETQPKPLLRVVVADNAVAAAGLSPSLQGLIVVVRDPRGANLGPLAARHIVLMPAVPEREASRTVRLTRPAIHAFADALQAAGFAPSKDGTSRDREADSKAELLARECGASITILRRRLPLADAERPTWRREIAGNVALRGALMAGRWTEAQGSDIEILQRLCEAPYATVKPMLLESLSGNDPPLERIEGLRWHSQAGAHWFVRSPIDAFEAWGPTIDQAALDRISTAARAVFVSHLASELASPPSEYLRDGIAETLLLLAARGPHTRNLAHLDPRGFVARLVEELIELAEHEGFLAAFDRQLPILIEAAPRPLLAALDRLIEGADAGVARATGVIERLFDERATSAPSHVHLLWALERLAWLPNYLKPISLALGRLARLDPGGRLGNRPQESLNEIFLCWAPQTDATVNERLGAIDAIVDRVPSVGWKLLARLLPKGHDSGGFHSRPQFLPAEYRAALTNRDVYLGYDGVVSRAVEHVGTDPVRWKALLDSSESFDNPEWRQRIVAKLRESAGALAANRDARDALWSTLDAKIRRHRRFPKAKWRWDDATLDLLEGIASKLKPDIGLASDRWLFDDWTPDLPADDEEEPIQSLLDRIDARRIGAIRTLLSSEGHGVAAVVALAEEAKLPGHVAATVATIAAADDAPQLVENAFALSADKPRDSLKHFAKELSRQAYFRVGEKWPAIVRAHAERGDWNDSLLRTAIEAWPPSAITRQIVGLIGPQAEREYWQKVQPHQADLQDEAELASAIEALLSHGRPDAAVEVIGHSLKRAIPGDLVLRSLEALGQLQAGIERRRDLSYEIDRAIKLIERDPQIDRVRIADIEERFLDQLVWGAREHLFAYDLLASDPDRFVRHLTRAFRAEGEEPRNVDETAKRDAKTSWELLFHWKTLPGQRSDGSVDGGHLKRWIDGVIAGATKVGRRAPALNLIGTALAQGPQVPDPRDGAWPLQEVREQIERLTDAEIGSGFLTAVYNRRGVIRKAMYEGGGQERALALQYRTWAKSCAEAGAVRTARLLDEIARGYDAEAADEDRRAQIDKRRGG